MHLNGSAVALAAVALSWVGIWWLRKRQLNFSLIAIFALAVGVPIGLVAGTHVSAIDPIGHIYINVLLATVAPLILVAIENLTYEEVAAVMNCQIGTVKSRVWRAREQLARMLGYTGAEIGNDGVMLSALSGSGEVSE